MNIVITEADLQSAPRLVREWIGALVVGQLDLAAPTPPAATPPAMEPLSAEEAAALLELIHNDHVASQVLFELGRSTQGTSPDGLRRLHLADVLHHARLTSPEQLMTALQTIENAFEELHPSAQGGLVAVDQAGNLFVREETSRSIEELWRTVVGAQFSRLADGNSQGQTVPIAARPVQ